MNPYRLTAAVVIAPLAAPLAAFLFPIVLSGEWPYNQTDYYWIVGVSTLFSYICFFVIGLPLCWLLKRWRMLHLLTLSIAGAASGIIAIEIFLYFFALSLESSTRFDWIGPIWGASLGFLVALTFGLIAGVSDVKEEHNAA